MNAPTPPGVVWRDGRVVEAAVLKPLYGKTYRGFESLSLRQFRFASLASGAGFSDELASGCASANRPNPSAFTDWHRSGLSRVSLASGVASANRPNPSAHYQTRGSRSLQPTDRTRPYDDAPCRRRRPHAASSSRSPASLPRRRLWKQVCGADVSFDAINVSHFPCTGRCSGRTSTRHPAAPTVRTHWPRDGWADPPRWRPRRTHERRSRVPTRAKDGRCACCTREGRQFEPSGAQWKMAVGRHDELYCSYYVRFAPGFDFVKGGKLPGLPAGRPTGAATSRRAGRMVSAHDVAHRREVVQYVYHVDQPTIYGEDFHWDMGGQRVFRPGTWHRVEHRIVINSPGQRDGIVQGWFDGARHSTGAASASATWTPSRSTRSTSAPSSAGATRPGPPRKTNTFSPTSSWSPQGAAEPRQAGVHSRLPGAADSRPCASRVV